MSNRRVSRSLAESNRLPILATSINDHLAAAEQATRHGLEHAIAAGLLLLEAKEVVGHGNWLAWLEANCHVGTRQAQAFMRLARHRHRLEGIKYAPSAHLTIHAAEALVGRPRPERPRGLPQQLDLLGRPEVPLAEPERGPPTNAKEMSALIGQVVKRLWKWSDAPERQRHKIIQILEHARRLIQQLAQNL